MDVLSKLITQNIVINEIKETDDSTILAVKMCIMDSLPTPNGWVVEGDELEKRANTLINKPIVCRYHSEVNNQFGTDYIGDHEETTVVARGTNGNITIPYNNTISIGVITNTEIIEIDNNEKQLWADGVLWLTKEFNSVSLIHEWSNNGIVINTSVEWGINEGTSTYEDGIEHMHDITFTGLCILNSRNNGIQPIIYGNYACSNLQFATNEMVQQFNNAIKTDIDNIGVNIENKKEGDYVGNKFLMALNQLSLGETRDKVMDALSKILTAEEYNNAWISLYGITDTEITYETYIDDKGWVNYKFNYTKTEDDEIEIDKASKVEIGYDWVVIEKSVVNSLETKVNELQLVVEEKSTLETTITELQEKLNTVTKDLTKASDEKVSLSETIATLNTKVNELEPYKVKADKEAYTEALDEKMSYYESKFNALNGADKFASAEVKTLVEDLLNVEKKDNAKMTLDSMLVDLVQPTIVQVNNSKTGVVTEPTSTVSNLIPNEIKSDLELYRN